MNDGGPAFPRPMGHNNLGTHSHSNEGMSLRDWFAGMALQGLLAINTFDPEGRGVLEYGPEISAEAFALAEAMIAARQKKPTP